MSKSAGSPQLDWISAEPASAATEVLIGNRVPRDFFLASGTGESEIAIHAGSFHHALRHAGIECCNLVSYSSILPARAREIGRPALVHGEVMECIMAVATGERGVQATAGITYGWLVNRTTGEREGGLVCEHGDTCDEEEARTQLSACLQDLYECGYAATHTLADINLFTETITPERRYGTAIVAICFCSYAVPVLTLPSRIAHELS